MQEDYSMKNIEGRKSNGPKCFLITGMGHSGTRLMTKMLARHPEVSVPVSILNRVWEYTPLHDFFIRSMDLTSLETEQYVICFEELKLILNDYVKHVDPNKKFFVLKLPYYPLNCLQFFIDFFEKRIMLIYLNRPKAKIINSFIHKGETRMLFSAGSDEFIRQLKKLNVGYRQKNLNTRDVRRLLSDLVDHVESKVDAWDVLHPDSKFLRINIEPFATDRAYLSDVLMQMGLSGENISSMLSVVQSDRLLVKFTSKLRENVLSSIIIFLKRIMKILVTTQATR
jgi:hypothetical protein